ncbi:MAG: LysR family transcriptional regulator [Roseibium sp.]|uniref:LysR family transcriptional regulator n=1 Tax=Roseibium sp. TaxID=1936156 RepID=UPI002608ACBA|nr:LysR family transcriptional regulator [Roseibium sp.]MCV0424179.1 LysR family transcriptional regulator [Roseibium sp.]
MKLKTLTALNMIVTRGSLNSAAQELNISEAALSRQITRLEASIGLKLFSRSGRTLSPTGECIELLRRIEPSLQELERINEVASEIRRLPLRRLRLSVMPRLVSAVTLPALSSFLNEQPDQDVSLIVEGRSLILRSVLNRSCDLALGSLPMHHSNLVSEHLCSLPTVAVLPPNHRFADRSSLKLGELADEAFILLPPNTMIGIRAQQMFDEAGMTPISRLHVSRVDDCCAFVAKGHGVAILDALMPDWAKNSVRLVPIESAPKSSFGFIRRSDEEVTQTAGHLMDLIKDSTTRFLGTMTSLQH